MKLSEKLMAYARQPKLKASLNKSITVTQYGQNRRVKKGTVSDMLVDLGNGEYHFEVSGKDLAFTVKADEITIL
jgi:hypothetical protein